MTTQAMSLGDRAAKFVLVKEDDPPGVVLMYVNGEGLSNCVAQSGPGDPYGRELEWVAHSAAAFYKIKCEWEAS